jgi:excisionase family DNA binding protein
MDAKPHRRYTTHQVARMLGVSDQSVSNWVDDGLIAADRTPGGHRRIDADQLIAFLRRQNMSVPPELRCHAHTVLVVDDDAALAGWLVRVIAQACPQASVLCAHSGFEAGRLVVAHRPRVVILDLYMPGMDGFEVCRQIKADPQTAGATVVAMTGQHTPQAEQAIRAAGAAACLAKPVDGPATAKLVADLLGQ